MFSPGFFWVLVEKKSRNHQSFHEEIFSSKFYSIIHGNPGEAPNPGDLTELPIFQHKKKAVQPPENITSSVLKIPSLKLTFSHLKMDGWNTFAFPIGFRPIFRGYYVSFSVFLKEAFPILKTTIEKIPDS